MENKTWIIILSSLLVISIIFNVSLIYTVAFIDMEWEDSYDKNDMEWCEISNQGNAVINSLIDELIYYDEEYKNMPYMVNLECFS